MSTISQAQSKFILNLIEEADTLSETLEASIPSTVQQAINLVASQAENLGTLTKGEASSLITTLKNVVIPGLRKAAPAAPLTEGQQKAIGWINEFKGVDNFAASLAAQYQTRGSLSDRQFAAALRNAEKVEQARQQAEEEAAKRATALEEFAAASAAQDDARRKAEALRKEIAEVAKKLLEERRYLGVAIDSTLESSHVDIEFWTIRKTKANGGTISFKRVIGGHGEVRPKHGELLRALQVIADLSEEELKAAEARYGVEIGRCCRCGKTLTSEWRKRGIGPDCFDKAGW